jgi:hypothetical protein
MRIKERTEGPRSSPCAWGLTPRRPRSARRCPTASTGRSRSPTTRSAGSDAYQTAKVLAAALKDEEFDLIIMGNQSSDARTTLVPAMLAEFLGMPALTYASASRSTATRQGRTARPRPAPGRRGAAARVVSVVEAINEPRYPSFKGIMAAKSKPLEEGDSRASVWTPARSGMANADHRGPRDHAHVRPSRPGEKVEDDGSGTVGAQAIADFLANRSSSRPTRDKELDGDMLVLVDHDDGTPKKVSNQILTAARNLGAGEVSRPRHRRGRDERRREVRRLRRHQGVRVGGSRRPLTTPPRPRPPPSSRPSRPRVPTSCCTRPTRSSPTSVARAAVRLGAGVITDAPTSSSTGTRSSRRRRSSVVT